MEAKYVLDFVLFVDDEVCCDVGDLSSVVPDRSGWVSVEGVGMGWEWEMETDVTAQGPLVSSQRIWRLA